MNIFYELKKLLFPFYKSENIKYIFKTLNEGHEKPQAMFVGGCVRKYLLNQKIDDIDIATVLKPEEIIKKFEKTNIKVKKTGIEHGTLTLVLEKQYFEITTLRKDVSTDGRHASVVFTDDWEDDSRRRDFSFNAIYMSEKGKIFDPQLGVSDLKNKVVKFIGKRNFNNKKSIINKKRILEN